MAATEDDESFGPQYGSQFDFTRKFEQTIMGILPTGLLIAAAPLWLYAMSRRGARARAGTTLWVKLIATVCLLGLEITSLVLYGRTHSIRTDTALAAASLSCVASFATILLITAEHRYTLRPTSFLSLYISVSICLDVVKSRSFFLRHGLDTLGSISVASAALKVVLVVTQEIPKTSLILDETARTTSGKEDTSGFWNRVIFAWLNMTLLTGFRRTISLKDLEPLGPALSAMPLFTKFIHHRNKKKQKPRKGNLMIACAATLWWPFCSVILPRLLFSALSFAQPFLLERILDNIQQEDSDESERIALVVASGLVFVARGMTKAAFMHANYRCVTATRGVLIAAMADKQLRLQPSEAKKSAITTLMTADIEGIEEALPEVHELWGFILDIAFGVYLLYRFIGLACLTVFGPFIFSTIYGILVGNWSGKALVAWNKSIESRVSAMSNILSQQLRIRMMGLGPIISKYAQQLRITELNFSRRFRVCTTTTMTGALSIESFTPVIILAAAIFWTKFKHGFTASVAFPILSLITIVEGPLFYLVDTYAALPRLWACMNRVQEYLELPEWSDNRKVLSPAPCAKAVEPREDEGGNRGEKDDGAEDIVIEFRDAWICPGGCLDALFQNINLKIFRSRIVALLGPTSSGKSTFLQTLIGEGTLLHGALVVAGLKWAFCSQTPYLTNHSIRQNIVGPNPFDEAWYNAVIDACQLREDIEQLTTGDETIVGSDGMNLSVGQRHRVGCARGVFSQAEVIVMDDIFASQDQATARAMMKALFGPDGLLRRIKSTVIFATHLSMALDVADELLQLDKSDIIQHKDFSSAKVKQNLSDAMGLTKQPSKDSKATQSQQAKPAEEEGVASDKTDKPLRLTAEAEKEKKEGEGLMRARGELGLYKFYFGSFSKANFFLWMASMLVVVFCAIFPDGYVRIWVDNAPNNNLYLLGYALIALARVVIGLWSQRLFYLQLLPQSGARLHQMLLDASMNATFDYICTVDSGTLLNRFSQDMSLVVQVLPIAMYRCVFMMLTSVVHIGFVLAGSSYAAIALPFIVLAVYLVQKYYLRTSRQLRYLDLESKSPLFIRFKESANGLEHLRSFGWTPNQFEGTLTILDDSQKAYYQMFCVQRWLNLVLDLLVAALAVFVVAIAIYVRKSTSPAATGLAYLTLINFGSSLTVTVKRWTEMEITLGSIARTRSFIEDTPQEKDSGHCHVPQDWPHHGTIEVQNVTSAYNSDSVLKDISFTVKRGDKVTISGRSGSGKSSLLVTLLNFLSYSGSICIDGIDIKRVPRQILRERITTITQTPVLLDGTILYNLVPFGSTGLSDSIIQSTLQEVGLWEIINEKGGLGIPMQDAKLSVAQQQLLCIARALLHHKKMESKIILMDEATAPLSMASTREVQRVLMNAFEDCTVLNIAHWESPLQPPDLTLQLDKGKLVSCAGLDIEEEGKGDIE